MESFHSFIQINMVPLIFAYGLAYFSAGLAILLQQRRMSNFRLAHYLWLLGAFGIIHGVAEWGDIFIPIQSNHISEIWISLLFQLQEMAWAVSFAFLLQFGISMIAPRLPFIHRVQSFVRWYAVYWSTAVIVIEQFLPAAMGQSWIRYMLCFPAAVLTAMAFLSERKRFFVKAGSPVATGSLTFTAIAFGVYAILGGLVVPQNGVWPLTALNNGNIHSWTGMPIHFWRMLIGVAIAVFVIKSLSVFDMEFRNRLENAEREQALLRDRHRIARDLHDGVVQSIYAAGLQLELAALKAGRIDAPEVNAHVRHVIKQLNHIISDIRKYIFNLGSVRTGEIDIYEYIEKAADEFMAHDNIDASILIEGQRFELTPEQQQDMAFIVHESLSNVIKHASASNVLLKMLFDGEALLFQIEDDGMGIDPLKKKELCNNGGHGMRSMFERAKSMGAEFSVSAGRGNRGTVVTLRIPRVVK